VCSSGSSVIDYFLVSYELEGKVSDLSVIERFESKHLPVAITVGQRDPVTEKSQSKFPYIEKTMWNEDSKPIFEASVNSVEFQTTIKDAETLLSRSVNESVCCLSDGLVKAAECMKKKIYTGPRKSAWFDRECTELKRRTRRAWRKFKRTKQVVLKEQYRKEYVECRKKYREMLQEKSKQHKARAITVLAENADNSKLFWNEVRKLNPKSKPQPDIGKEAWLNHFKTVFGDSNACGLSHAENNEPIPLGVDELDKPITESEIVDAIGHLKANKAAGIDGITGDMLKVALPVCLAYMVKLFNQILNSGEYPETWTSAIIVPIHKSGDKNTPNNYRGVSLLSVLGKVFARVLNKRLSTWAETNNHFPQEQGGFRAGHSTVDNMFVLYGIVQRYLTKRSGKIYVCFIDFQKAFDTVNRGILWNVLKRIGVGGKMLKILQSMYKTVTSCVRCNEGLTEYFDCPNGVRQGCVLSPTLFSFFINELATEIRENGRFGIQLTPSIVQILILLFADDVILSSYCARGLQCQINILREFAERSAMTVNLSKTKIIVFRKGGFLGHNEKWWYGKEEIEVVNSYKYLGLHFTTKLSLTQTISELATKAKARTVQILKCLWRLGHIDKDVFLKIFDAQVLPVIMYGSEIWGFQQFDAVEKIQIYACKKILNVGQQTPNKMVSGDLGRFPLYIQTAVRCIKYWLRVVALPDEKLPKRVYNMMYFLQDRGKKMWSSHIKDMLFKNGFGCVWQHQNVGNTHMFLSIFKQRLQDQYKQTWTAEICSKERYEFYSSFKMEHLCERYIDYQQKRCFRDCYVQFRFGISPIYTHKLRYKKCIRPSELLCPMCRQEIESERHVLFDCVYYQDLRQRVSILKTVRSQLDDPEARVMMAQDEQSIRQLSWFLYSVFNRRKCC
jgi:hypothetical protein